MATYNLTTSIPTEFEPGDILNCPYSGNKVSINLLPGVYKLEVWGAEGGYRYSNTYSGKGGYAVGSVTIGEATKFYLYAGASGNTAGAGVAPFNGGGYRASYAGGGGGSDVRVGQDSLYARVIVAGGGGSDGSSTRTGMYGGGETGGSSTESFTAYSSYCGKGGTQTYSGYSASYTAATQSTSSYYGGFGFGGSGLYASSGYGGAGGGGWYGGSGTYPDGSGDDDRGGGGGSGYIYTASTASNYPTGCLLNSTYYLSEASMTSGNTFITSPTGTSESGHEGDGYVRITVLELHGNYAKCYLYDQNGTLSKTKYLKFGSSLSEVSIAKACLYEWRDTNGNLVTVVPETESISLYGTVVGRASATYDILTESIPSTFIAGDVVECPYSGAIKTISLPKGYYRLQCWGAQGGDSQYGSNAYYNYGGKGGYASGILKVNTSTTYYLVTGGRGATNSSSSGSGGYNGGGNSQYYAGAGGGATHIATATGLLSTLSSNLNSIILVGGGGGGGNTYSTSYRSDGGAGGGKVGCNSVQTTTNASYDQYQGTGGTQTYGGSCNSISSGEGAGSFGQGGRYYSSGGAGGGAGYYGGGGGYQYAGGGGGSSYANSSLIGVSLIPGTHGEYGRSGDGLIRITYLGVSYSTNKIDLSNSSTPSVKANDILTCGYTGQKVTVTLPKGKYKIECYGASGGNTGSGSSTTAPYDQSRGMGGYSCGTLELSEKTTLYLYVGGRGSDGANEKFSQGGFNGGGNGGYHYGGAGGGATDVRIGTDNLSSRVLIAGGGGGAGYHATYPIFGGAGGGLSGLNGDNINNQNYRCKGATQTGGGTVTTYMTAGNPGTLGQGGNCYNGTSNVYNTGGGGGGGLYGGAGSGFYNNDTYSFISVSGGSGGSGFAYLDDSVTECSLDSKYLLTDASTCASGNDGNGYIMITVLEAKSLEMYCKIDNAWKAIANIYVKINGQWKIVNDLYTSRDNSWSNLNG